MLHHKTVLLLITKHSKYSTSNFRTSILNSLQILLLFAQSKWLNWKIDLLTCWHTKAQHRTTETYLASDEIHAEPLELTIDDISTERAKLFHASASAQQY